MLDIAQLQSTTAHVEKLRREMEQLASALPKYETVLSMRSVGKTLGPQLIAEIGDIQNYTKRESLTAFAGVDLGVDESSSRCSKSVPASKCGPSRLRKTLFLIITSLLQTAPADDKVFQFLDRKRAKGKLYLVYMTAGANKFLRIYYGKVKACIAAQSETV